MNHDQLADGLSAFTAEGNQFLTFTLSQMDRVTQTNASQTEEMSGTAQALLSHAEELSGLVARFKLEQDGAGKPAAGRPAASSKVSDKAPIKKTAVKSPEAKARGGRAEPVGAVTTNGHGRIHELDQDTPGSEDGFQEF
jgi:hypothetical protein